MAIAMRQQMKLLRERWKKMGYSALHIRMGISTGYCHVGNYGATHRMAYTIVGRDVNLAHVYSMLLKLMKYSFLMILIN